MKRKLFTFLMAFLVTLSGAVWGQTTTEVDITGITGNSWTDKDETTYSVKKGADSKSDNNVVTIKANGTYTIKDDGADAGDKSNVQIKFGTSVTEVNITLKGVKTNAYLDNGLKASSNTVYPDRCAMEIPSGVTVTLNWEGDNKLWSGGNRAGINVKPNATLIIAGPANSGSLEVGSYNNSQRNAHTYGAGIGGDAEEPDFGTIIIKSGKVTAYSQDFRNDSNNAIAYGAGIGGGYDPDATEGEKSSKSGSIQILGGEVTAKCDVYSGNSKYGAAIGGGNGGTCSNITITGGTITTSTGNNVDNIGNGNSSTAVNTPEVIVAPADSEGTTPSVTIPTDLNNTLVVGTDGNATLKGTVNVPAGMQIYAPGIENKDNVVAYRVEITDSKIEDPGDGTHSHTNYPSALEDTYFGPGVEETITLSSDVFCGDSYFLGWYDNTSIETSKTITIPDDAIGTSTDKVLYKGQTVWVEKDRNITVASGHTWAVGDDSDAPAILVSPEDIVSSLTFELVLSEEAKKRLGEVSFSDAEGSTNVLVGTPKLLDTESYWTSTEGDVKVKVKVGDDGEVKEVKVNVTIHSGNLRITNVEIMGTHTYDGQVHNNTRTQGNGNTEHSLNVTAQLVDENGDVIEGEAAVPVKENIHYYISEFSFTKAGEQTGETKTASRETSPEIKEAGTYSSIKIKARTNSQISFADNANELTVTGDLTVNPKELTLAASNEVKSITGETEPDFNTNWDQYVKVNGVIGQETVTPSNLVATVTPTVEDWWTKPGAYTVTFSVGENTSTDNTNYTFAADATASCQLAVKGTLDNPDVQPGDNSDWELVEGEGNTFSREYNGEVPTTGSIGSLKVLLANNTEVTLEEGTDKGFTVNYDNAGKDVGEYEVTVTFQESTYISGGTATVTLKITEKPMTVDFNFPSVITDTENINWSKSSITYTGNVTGEEPTISDCYLEVEGSTVFLRDFSLKDNDNFKQNNYTINYIGSANDITANVEEGKQNADDEGNYDVELPDDEITIDPNDDDDDKDHGHGGSDINRPAKYYNIYVDTAATSDGVELSLSKDVVKEGNQVSVYIDKILEGYNAENMKVQIKRSLYGYWEELEEGVQPGEYIIYNIYHDIYVKVTDVEKDDATGIEDVEGVKAYAKDGSIYVYTPNREEVTIISMSGAIIKNEEQVGLQSYSVSRGIYIVRIGDKVFKLKN